MKKYLILIVISIVILTACNGADIETIESELPAENNDTIGFSLPVSHAIGDYANFEVDINQLSL